MNQISVIAELLLFLFVFMWTLEGYQVHQKQPITVHVHYFPLSGPRFCIIVFWKISQCWSQRSLLQLLFTLLQMSHQQQLQIVLYSIATIQSVSAMKPIWLWSLQMASCRCLLPIQYGLHMEATACLPHFLLGTCLYAWLSLEWCFISYRLLLPCTFTVKCGDLRSL